MSQKCLRRVNVAILVPHILYTLHQRREGGNPNPTPQFSNAGHQPWPLILVPGLCHLRCVHARACIHQTPRLAS